MRDLDNRRPRGVLNGVRMPRSNCSLCSVQCWQSLACRCNGSYSRAGCYSELAASAPEQWLVYVCIFLLFALFMCIHCIALAVALLSGTWHARLDCWKLSIASVVAPG